MSNILQVILTFVLAVTPWFLPTLELHVKIIFALIIATVSCIIYCMCLTAKLDKLRKKLASIEQNHDALAAQFDEKIDLIRRYRRASQHTLSNIQIACANTKEAKLTTLYTMFLAELNEVNDDGGM